MIWHSLPKSPAELHDDISLVNSLNWEISENDPGVFIIFNNDEIIDQAMTLPGLVLPAGLFAELGATVPELGATKHRIFCWARFEDKFQN